MIRALGFSIVNCLLFIVAGIIHRIMVRYFGLPIKDVLVYWGAFAGIFFLVSFIALLIFNPKRS
ncbi:bacteriocin-like WGxF protein [Paenibacillus nasutitermitis]|uniref:Uncharacterized protein n=1 Tax=Paenibacillus nasutitermitis TaxID=1652958 RepID=A0A916ZAN8_9BACL|nr:hypothetical protein GCM10010911_48590 [Paenibacillus nasutitermitis]